MTYTPQPQRPVLLPREADAQRYAEWAVRRIGRAFALAVFGPVLFGVLAVALQAAIDPGLVITLGTVLCVAGGVLYLCFAHAPR